TQHHAESSLPSDDARVEFERLGGAPPAICSRNPFAGLTIAACARPFGDSSTFRRSSAPTPVDDTFWTKPPFHFRPSPFPSAGSIGGSCLGGRRSSWSWARRESPRRCALCTRRSG